MAPFNTIKYACNYKCVKEFHIFYSISSVLDFVFFFNGNSAKVGYMGGILKLGLYKAELIERGSEGCFLYFPIESSIINTNQTIF